ncbi:MAG: D-ribose pyranase [Desulfurococcaceae archaeon]
MILELGLALKKGGIINPALLYHLGQLGHGDIFVVSDAGLPIPSGVVRLDFAIRPGLPGFVEVVNAILSEGLAVERAVLAVEIKERSPLMHEKVLELLAAHGIGGDKITYVPHERFKAEFVAKAKFVVRTGEYTPYANVAFVSGVPF